MASDAESSGDEEGVIRLDLIGELKKVLDEYPDNGQIIKEMIQNAEDAGARTVNILTDARWLHKDLDEETLKKHRHLKFLRAPALCVYNDAEFTTEDWKGIRMLHASVKEKDPLKVGRFGLGFKSVFHLTDCLTIISGGRIMYMDPSLDERRCCRSKTLAKLKGKEMDSVSHCIDSVLGVTQKTFQPDVGHFPGTMFWFPLREEASNLSKNVYTQDKVHDLFNAFKAEARSMLLFLKNIERVEIFAREETHDPEKLFTVEVAMSCLEAVRTERRRFIKGLQESVSNLPAQCLECVTEMTIATSDHQAHSHDSRCWLVVNYHPGQGEVSSELAELCTGPDLAYQPHVGVAIPREQLREFKSHIFCFLPLPLHASSPTGLPVHVNGYFALTQNRRDLKWPTQDQLDNKAHLEAPERWNRLMVKELVPRAYVRLLQRLKQLHGQNSDVFYAAWPDVKHVNDKGRPVVEPLFRTMATKPSFYTQARGGDWISLNQAVLPDFPADTSPDVRRAVLKVYTENNRNLIKLPDHVERGLKELELLQSVTTVSPQGTSQLLPNCLPRLTFSEKLHVLQYFCCQSDAAKLLQNQHLLPLANGDFGVFGAAVTYWCEENLLRLFPGLERQFVSCDTGLPPVVREKLRQLAESSLLYLRRLQENDPQVVRLLEESLQERFGRHQPSLSPQDPWIQKVWQFLSSTHPWCRDLGQMSHLTLLPCQTDSSLTLFPLNGLYVCRTARGFTQLNPALASSLTRLIITVLPQLPSYVTHPGVVGGLVQYPSAEGVLEVLRKLTRDDSLRNAAVLNFNSCASSEEVNALVSFLADIKSRLGGEVDLFRELNLFNSTDGRRVSVTNVNEIVPGCSLPIEPPWSLLSCTSTSERAALKLGARKKTLKEVVNDILGLIYKYSQPDVINFMKFFISRDDLLSDSSLTSGARQVSFLSTRSGQLKAAEDLYDPSCQVLVDMFHAEDRFPCGEFATPNMLKRLRKLGLMTEKTVESGDLLEAARRIESFWKQSNMSVAEKKAEGLWKFLTNHGSILQGNDLSTLSQIRCLPCLQPHSKPRDYPSSLPIMSEPKITRPAEMSQIKHIRLCGSAMPIARPNLPETLASKLQVDSQLTPHHVLQHLRMVVHSYNAGQVAQYRLILADIFQCLNASRADGTVWQTLQQTECVLVESEDSFVRPDRFWVQTAKTDIDLKPYRFPLPKDMMPAKDLIRQCGSSLAQDEGVLQEVLGEIRDKHEHATHSREVFRNDLQLVKRILDELKSKECAAKGTVLLPIDHHEDSVLRFKPAGECTFGGQVGALADDEEAIFFIHPEILPGTAKALGALDIRQRALTGAEGLDYGYGQQEKLTTRLHNLLKDSYTDGFSVPKELIQNADDAGATEVRLLLDERENKDARSNLISDNMASLQGPAIWAFNDATFSDADFENIVKLGAGTKQEDASKVGRFGLGFNAVYNLTDVPSFISKHTLAIFDPHAKYLPEGAGLKLDFGRPINQSLLSRMPNQFKPFQGVFDCRLEKDEGVFYSGTLFRFPLRTEQQAEKSEIKAESYSQTKRREFLKMLLDRAGSLLMFTQNVRKVKVFHLPPNCSDPRQARCLLTVTRTSLGTNLLSGPSSFRGSIMQYCTANWRKNTDIKILEQVSIVLDVTDDATAVCGVDKVHVETHWTLAWATGTDESAKAVQRHNMVGFVPLATVAVLLTENTIQPLSKSPFGFYTSGHLFCFMPLPKEMVAMSLPVHVNGTFDLTSSRRSLQVRTEDDMGRGGLDWNSALFGDAVCRAYLLLLEKVAEEAIGDQNYRRYFELWPDSKEDSLDKNFYRRLVSDGNKVFPVPGQDTWVAFSDAWFLDPDFRESECGQLAWDAADHFWDRDGGLVDVPAHVCRLIQRKGQTNAFQERVITKREFFEQFFFPNIADRYWQPASRDKLVHHALVQSDSAIQDLLSKYKCIPCEGTGNLELPRNLIHPSKQASKLYRSSEGRFPRGSETHYRQEQINFCSADCLARLEKLGMIADDLPLNMVEERARSVAILLAEDRDSAMKRARNLIDYLASLKGFSFRFDSYDANEKQSLSKIKWLPVMRKPDDWPYPWKGDEGPALDAPEELYSDTLKDLVACKAKLLDSKVMEGQGSLFYGKKKDVFQSLRVKVDEDYKDTGFLELAIEQLLTIANHHEQNPTISPEKVRTVCSVTYSFLNKCITRSENTEAPVEISQRLSPAKVVWTGDCFVSSSQVAFYNASDCRPYLFQLDVGFRSCSSLFQHIGVKDKFGRSDASSVLTKIHKSKADFPLEEETIKLVSRVAQLLCEAMKAAGGKTISEEEDIFLPDIRGVMLSTRHLCLDDCPWLQESETMRFVHESISPETARVLGVETKRGKDFDELMSPIPFGQHEKLTTRIRGLLEGYTFDSSLFKELLQNADDAGATEIKFILDMRKLGTMRVPEGWASELQGPALCVYNNKSFTTKDMEGIQNLGEGSKRDDVLKTGQYGVGFNAIYHITDIPSFWTRENDVQEVICVFDPNCRYVRKTLPNQPGVKLRNIDRVRAAYPDMFGGYLSRHIDMTKPGTLFRFPLRTEAMASVSTLKQPAVTGSKIQELLRDFAKEAKSCLLFLNNLQEIGIYTVSDSGELKPDYEAKKSIPYTSAEQHQAFKDRLVDASRIIGNTNSELLDIPDFEAVVYMTLTDSFAKEKWLTVNRVGFADRNIVSDALLKEWKRKHFRLLPRGGVAVTLSKEMKGNKAGPGSDRHHAFCILPLPVNTGLPMHVNGHFVLDHETRRNLWENQNDAKTEWNTVIAQHVIVPAFVTAIQQVKHAWFTAVTDPTEVKKSVEKLSTYHTLFPKLGHAPSPFWKKLMEDMYRKLAVGEFPVFPVTCVDTPGIQWVSAVKQNGFPGYFSNLAEHFSSSSENASANKPVKLSQGGVSQASSTTSDTSQSEKKAEELANLLKKLNMKVLHTPFRVYEAFKKSCVEEVQQVTPATVIEFLKSAGSNHIDGCSLRDLPQPVAKTPIQTTENAERLIKFIHQDKEFHDKLEGLPLSLRQSEELYFFQPANDDEKPIVSRFCQLLPKSARVFLNKAIYAYFPVSDKTQTMLREFEIPLFESLLSDSLEEQDFGRGEVCALHVKMLPQITWLRDVWDFIQTRLEKQINGDTDVVTARKRKEDELTCLADWSLIPVKKKNAKKEEESLLYPVRFMHHVLHLSDRPDQANQRLWEIMRTLPLAFLDAHYLPMESVLTRIVASTGHPLAVLHALTSCKTVLTSSRRDAYDILFYFDSNLKVLQESSKNETELRQELKSLPLYQFLDDSLVHIVEGRATLCLKSSVPKDGLAEWSQVSGHCVQLIRQKGVPGSLRDFLHLEKVPDEDFYRRFLLPTLDLLPRYAIVTQMTAVRYLWSALPEKERPQLTNQLRSTAFIESCGNLYPAHKFYSPFEAVFRAMCQQESFPPEPYCGRDWEPFMTAAGMISDVTNTMFIGFARSLEEEGRSGLSPDIEKKSDTLVRYLFRMRNLFEGSLMRQVQSIAFVRPSKWSDGHEGKLLAKIADPFSSNRLVTFAGSCREEDLYLVWSSSPILYRDADPSCYVQAKPAKTRKAILREFPFLGDVPKQKVILHFTNVCRLLAEPEGQKLFGSMKEADVQILQAVMDKLYGYLSQKSEKWNLAELENLPVICDVKNRTMLKAENVILELRDEEAIAGRIQKAPREFGRYFDLFKELGVAERVTANHYAKVLSCLKTEAEGKSLHVEEMKVVKKAIEGVFRCLKSKNEEERNLRVGELYLPAESEHLEVSSALTFKDDILFGERLREPPSDIHFFIGFEALEIKVQFPLEEVSLLPGRYQMNLLSEIVRELIMERNKLTASEGSCSRILAEKLRHPNCLSAIVRLAYHHYRRSDNKDNQKFTEETAQRIVRALHSISIKETQNLQTILELKGSLVPGSECRKLSYADKTKSDCKSSTVYVDSAACADMQGNMHAFIHSLALAVHFMTDFILDNYLLHQVLMFPAQAEKILDAEKIARCDFKNAIEESVFPRAGTYIRVDHHCYLDNNFCVFYKGEHVGFEAYDPAVHSLDSSDEDAVYIYAVVIEEVKPEGQEDVPLLARRYRVDLGPEREEAVVSVTQLYKFVRKARQGKSKALVKYEGPPDAQVEEALPTDLAAVLREIRKTLTEAWRLLGEDDRRRVVKRLYLKWHPDKNPNRTEFCTRVVQAIQRYVDLLKEGKTLPEDEDEVASSSGGYRSSSAYSSFFDHMDRRGRAYRRHFSSGSGFDRRYGAGSGPNPQLTEGKRWLKQAEADLSAAQTARGSSNRGHNWVCYECHQAVEKALKSILYCRNADNELLDHSHELVLIAYDVGDSLLTQWAREMEEVVGKHTYMRYPGKRQYACIPADVYIDDEARSACDIAARVIDRVQCMWR